MRDFLYIDDLINAIIKTLRKRNLIGHIINIGSGKPTSIKKLILSICRLAKGGNLNLAKYHLEEMRLINFIQTLQNQLNYLIGNQK